MKYFPIIVLLLAFAACQPTTPEYASYDDYPAYPEEDLWPKYSPTETHLTLWSPVAEQVQVHLYRNGDGGEPFENHPLVQYETGLWKVKLKGDMNGVYYTYQVKVDGDWLDETPGIYAQAVGVNGKRAMIIDLESTNPEGWADDKGPAVDKPSEALIYELHVRDITIHPNSGSSFPGKYLGLVEEGTKGPGNVSTAIDHMKELGITHVHLLPSYDHHAIEEAKLDSAQFNWGYDPQNYNVPEGSFSSDPFNAEVRIKEFKQMVKAFHDNGIGVILDVVYNHTGRNETSNFSLETPGYYYRFNEDGSWSNASACGNETASERPMMRKYILESVKYWVNEYHLDGFRFDLMGIHDIETMNQVAAILEAINSDIFVYGEGWTAGSSPLPENDQALKKHTHRMTNISAFSDDLRDGLKGSVFVDEEGGFVSGTPGKEPSIQFGVVGSIQHDQIDYKAVNYSDAPWAKEPWQAVSYVSCHDNQTLYDKLIISRADADEKTIKAMHKLSNAIVLTTQGTPFLHAGVEMMRTKGGEHNSFNKPDEINRIDWNWKIQHNDVFEYYRDLIQLRKNHPAFYMPTAEMVREKLKFHDSQPFVVRYRISENANDDAWSEIEVCYNASTDSVDVELEGEWTLAVLGNEINEAGIREVSGKISVPAISMMIAYR
ncbi:MAG: type I pullulanase [Bacteroidota bacterium]